MKAKWSVLLLIYGFIISVAVIIYPQRLDLARMYFRSYQVDLALKELEAILKSGDDVFLAIQDYASMSETVGDIDKAISLYQRLLEITPGKAAFLEKLSYLYAWNQDPHKSAEVNERLYRNNPKDPKRLKKLVDDLVWFGKLEKAAFYLENYLRLRPDDLDCRIRLAQLYSSQKRVDDLVKQYLIIEKAMPGDIEWKMGLAEAFFWKKDVPRAIAKFHEALEIDPGRLAVYERMANMHIWNNDLDKGFAVAREILKKFRHVSDAPRIAAGLFERTKHFDEAAALYLEFYRSSGRRDDLLAAIQYMRWIGRTEEVANLYGALADSFTLAPGEFGDFLDIRVDQLTHGVYPKALLSDTTQEMDLTEDLFATISVMADPGGEPEEYFRILRGRIEGRDKLLKHYFQNSRALLGLTNLRARLAVYFFSSDSQAGRLSAGAAARKFRDERYERIVSSAEDDFNPLSKDPRAANRLLNLYLQRRHEKQLAAMYEWKNKNGLMETSESIRLAEWYYSQKIDTQGIAVLEANRAKLAGNAFAYRMLAAMYLRSGASGQKLLSAREALRRVAPDDIENLTGLVKCYEAGKRISESRDIIRHFEKRHGKDARALKSIANHFLWAELPAHAIEFYGRAVERNPDDTASLKMQGSLLLWGGRTKEAEACISRYIDRVPDDIDAVYRLAEVHAQRWEPLKAHERYTEFVSLYQHLPAEKKSEDLLTQYARALWRLDRLPQAAALYRQLYDRNPADRNLRAEYAEALIALGNYQRAESILKKRR